jgi:hypothetical protein
LDGAFINRALPQMGWLRWTALAVLDFGIIGWTVAFVKNAKGTAQKFTSVVMIGFDFLGVAIISAVEIMTGGQTLYQVDTQALQAWGIRGLIFWVIINALALLVYHLVSPAIMKEIQEGRQNDKLNSMTDKKFEAKLNEVADRLAEEKAELKFKEKMIEMGAREDVESYRRLPSPTGYNDNGHGKEPVEISSNGGGNGNGDFLSR